VLAQSVAAIEVALLSLRSTPVLLELPALVREAPCRRHVLLHDRPAL
jgi:hypothetical protein